MLWINSTQHLHFALPRNAFTANKSSQAWRGFGVQLGAADEAGAACAPGCREVVEQAVSAAQAECLLSALRAQGRGARTARPRPDVAAAERLDQSRAGAGDGGRERGSRG